MYERELMVNFLFNHSYLANTFMLKSPIFGKQSQHGMNYIESPSRFFLTKYSSEIG